MPQSVPEEVEALVREIRERSPGYSDAQVWATAWSVYCKHLEPGSEHCEDEPVWYLPENDDDDDDNPHGDSEREVMREHIRGNLFTLWHTAHVAGTQGQGDSGAGWHWFELRQDGETVLRAQWPNMEAREAWDHLARAWIMYWDSHT